MSRSRERRRVAESTWVGPRSWAIVALLPLLLAAPCESCLAAAAAAPGHWVGSWGTAQQLTPTANPPSSMKSPPPADPQPSPILAIPERLKDQTVRMWVRTTIGGPELRVQLSNAFGYAPVLIGSTHVAVRSQGSGVVAGTDRPVTFGGQARVELQPGAVIVSDPIDLGVAPRTALAVSLYIPEEVAQITVHPLGLHTTYLAVGDQTSAASLPGARECNSYLWLTGVEVWAPSTTQAIVAYGDSITDGYATTPNSDQAWPAVLFQRLSARRSEASRSVLNLGISGNRVLHDGAGTSALARFDRDILSRPGVRWVLFLEGINDISFPAIPGSPPQERISADDLIAGYRKLIGKAHLHGLKVMGATLLPWEGVWTYTAQGEAIRQQVNRWIRSGGAFDSVVDFDAVTRDRNHPARLQPRFDSGDHVHPNDAGNRAMAGAIELSFFDH